MIERTEPLVSVVTPLYNGGKFIAECIESVQAQDYKNWRMFILDNNSSDDSHQIATDYASKDSRIVVQKNDTTLDQMPNWNRSMLMVDDDCVYCKVVHADDWLFPNCLTEMVALAEANPNVGLIGAYRLEEERVTLDGLAFPSTVVSGAEMVRRRFLGAADLFGSPTSIMYRADQLHKRKKFYNEANLHADTEICYEILLEQDFGFVHQVLTFTRRHNETTTAFAKRMQTYMPCDLMMLKKFGPKVLSELELSQVVNTKLRNYYRFLGYRLLQCKKTEYREFWKEFWAYHKAAFSNLGYTLSPIKVLGYGFFSLYKSIISKLVIA